MGLEPLQLPTVALRRIPIYLPIIVLLGMKADQALSQQASTRVFPFSLTIEESRNEKRITPLNSNTVSVEFAAKIALFGRIKSSKQGPNQVLYTFNDSITYQSDSPVLLKTFMSADTMYYATEKKRNVISRGYLAKYDSMLACIFRGKAIKVSFSQQEESSEGGYPPSASGFSVARVSDLKKDCKSGEYSHINPLVSLGAFFISYPVKKLQKGDFWYEQKTLPGFTGLPFHPEINLQCKSVDVEGSVITIVIYADTTLREISLGAPSKNPMTILKNKIHIGGTVLMDTYLGIPTKGEMRIDESIDILNPQVNNNVSTKECSFLFRLKVQR